PRRGSDEGSDHQRRQRAAMAVTTRVLALDGQRPRHLFIDAWAGVVKGAEAGRIECPNLTMS
ncbi:hypothetical protein Dimus_007675, partial [Dionaea muscipula]